MSPWSPHDRQGQTCMVVKQAAIAVRSMELRPWTGAFMLMYILVPKSQFLLPHESEAQDDEVDGLFGIKGIPVMFEVIDARTITAVIMGVMKGWRRLMLRRWKYAV